MPRLPRIVLPGQPQLILQRSHRAQAIFHAEGDYRFYLDSLAGAAERYGGDVHAYVLMPDHVRLLITPHTDNSIARILQQVGRSFARYLNSAYQRSGSLWDGRYKAAIIDSEHYLLACYRYLELDPVRSMLAAQPGDYPWSSYRAHALGEPDALIRDHALYQALGTTPGERGEAYSTLMRASLDEPALAAIQSATLSDWVLGSEHFKAALIAALEERNAADPEAEVSPRLRELMGEV